MSLLRRSIVAVVAIVCAGTLLGVGGAGASNPSAKDPCARLATLQDDLQSLGASQGDDYDADTVEQVGKGFRKVAKKAPKQLKAALKKIGKLYTALGRADDQATAVAEYAEDVRDLAPAFAKFSEYLTTECAGSGGSGGSGGSLVLGGEEIALGSARCYLQEQEAAGETIELTGQATGTSAAGDEVRIDFSRYAPDSRFAGDDVSIDVGEVGASMGYHATLDAGTVGRDGSTLSASDIEVRGDDGQTLVVSFILDC